MVKNFELLIGCMGLLRYCAESCFSGEEARARLARPAESAERKTNFIVSVERVSVVQ